jgi:hypothetical protein
MRALGCVPNRDDRVRSRKLRSRVIAHSFSLSTSNFQFENVRHGSLCYMLGAACGCASHVVHGSGSLVPIHVAWAVWPPLPPVTGRALRRAPLLRLRPAPRAACMPGMHARPWSVNLPKSQVPQLPLGTSPQCTFGRRCRAREAGPGGTLGGKAERPKAKHGVPHK